MVEISDALSFSELARCKTMVFEQVEDRQPGDPELLDPFYPQRGTAQITARNAKRICNGVEGESACPARQECLEYALGAKERFGIWGGKSERERAKIAKRRRVDERKRELEVEAQKEKRAAAARAAWERRRAPVDQEQAATQVAAIGSVKENRGKSGVTTRRARTA